MGALSIDYGSRRVTVAGRPVKLTATEYEVLRVLSVNAGHVVTYHALLRQAWSRHDGTVKPKLVHAVVQTLRRKLGEDGSRAALILNERGLGYRMPAPDRSPRPRTTPAAPGHSPTEPASSGRSISADPFAIPRAAATA